VIGWRNGANNDSMDELCHKSVEMDKYRRNVNNTLF